MALNNSTKTVIKERRSWFPIRGQISMLTSVLLGIACVAVIFGLWWFVTLGEDAEIRMVSPQALPSPHETFDTFQSLWFERELTRNTITTLKRVTIGFGLAAIVGIPLGVLAGCFPPVRAFLTPLILFGRNIPIAALVPLTFFFFGIGEEQKIMFIFMACVAFIIADTATSVLNIGQQYIDTAYTLGAKRWQLMIKVLVPLSLPAVFDSLRLLFGLAFGYIMLAETIKLGSESGGLGNLILTSQRIGPRAHIYLIILIIPVVAFVIDRMLFLIQRGLFPHKYGGNGWLAQIVRACIYFWEDNLLAVGVFAILVGGTSWFLLFKKLFIVSENVAAQLSPLVYISIAAVAITGFGIRSIFRGLHRSTESDDTDPGDPSSAIERPRRGDPPKEWRP